MYIYFTFERVHYGFSKNNHVVNYGIIIEYFYPGPIIEQLYFLNADLYNIDTVGILSTPLVGGVAATV